MSLKKNTEGYIEGLDGEQGAGKWCCCILISNNDIIFKNQVIKKEKFGFEHVDDSFVHKIWPDYFNFLFKYSM